jgi:hypothetical protein
MKEIERLFTPTALEPATFRLVASSLIHYASACSNVRARARLCVNGYKKAKVDQERNQ